MKVILRCEVKFNLRHHEIYHGRPMLNKPLHESTRILSRDKMNQYILSLYLHEISNFQFDKLGSNQVKWWQTKHIQVVVNEINFIHLFFIPGTSKPWKWQGSVCAGRQVFHCCSDIFISTFVNTIVLLGQTDTFVDILLQAKSSTCPASNYKNLLTGW